MHTLGSSGIANPGPLPCSNGEDMNRDLRRMMQSFFDTDAPYTDSCWCPSVDVYRGADRWLVKFDLAGVRAEDIHLTISARRLTVEGQRRDHCILDNQQAYSMEISYNRFRRSVELPLDLTECELRSEYRDGMFLVLITPRSATA